MNQPDHPPELDQSPSPSDPQGEPNSSAGNDGMAEYYRLKQSIIQLMQGFTVVIFILVWWAIDLTTALNYCIGAVVSFVYLRMLAKDVEKLGKDKQSLSGANRLGLIVVMIFVASRLEQLQILPIFLGFLSYKVAIIFYGIRTTFNPTSRLPNP